MVSETFIFVALTILGFGIISGRIQRTVITPPMLFVTAGFLCGGHAVGLMTLGQNETALHLIGEITLILVLFTDASRIDFGLLRKGYRLPLRLLGLGLPLTILAGTIVAILIFDHFSIWEAAILAAILAPTDAALGQAVVSSPKVPARIRQALNVESGINDGVCLPLIIILLSTSAMECQPAEHWVAFTLKQVILGPIIGAAIGFLGGKLVTWGARSHWMSHTFQQLSCLGLALLAYALAEEAGGNGFIAAFCAGLALGNTAKEICECLYDFGEAEGALLIMLVFLMFGAALLYPVLAHLDGRMVLYAVLSLTLTRMIPVSLGLLGAKLVPATHFFLGWFGPRGIASILFVLLMLEEGKVHEGIDEEILHTVLFTVLLSVFAHGLTAWPASGWYAAHADRGKREDMAEHEPVPELKVRGHAAFHGHPKK